MKKKKTEKEREKKGNEVLEQPKVEKSQKGGRMYGGRQGGKKAKQEGKVMTLLLFNRNCQRELPPGLKATLHSALFILNK